MRARTKEKVRAMIARRIGPMSLLIPTGVCLGWFRRGMVICGIALILLAGSSLQGLQATQPEDAGESTAPALSLEDLEQQIAAVLAEEFGVPADEVTRETDLLDDLFADHMAALEALAKLCERYNVPTPARGDLTTVGRIAAYIHWALANPERALTMGHVPSANRGVGNFGSDELRIQLNLAEGASVPLDRLMHRQAFFFATDRARTGDDDPNDYFSGERNSANTLIYGRGEVTIPVAVHSRGNIERPISNWLFELSENPRKHIVFAKLEELDHAAFFQQVAAGASTNDAEGESSVLVFIHGFNVDFDVAARRVAQIVYDLDFPALPLLYSWPSDGFELYYLADREDVEWSAPHLEVLLEELVVLSQVKRVHIVAHSMGNQALIRALRRLALRRGDQAEPLFENVVLAAPDFDAGNFSDHIGAQIIPLARHWTIYASDSDQALRLSKFASVPRLGMPLTVIAGMETVNVSGIDVTPWSVPEFHSYYATKKPVIDDLISIFDGRRPEERNLKPAALEGLPYWILK